MKLLNLKSKISQMKLIIIYNNYFTIRSRHMGFKLEFSNYIQNIQSIYIFYEFQVIE